MNVELTHRILEDLGKPLSLIKPVADRAGPRPPLLPRHRQAARSRLGAAGAVRAGLARHDRVVPPQRVVVAADQGKRPRLPRLLRGPVRAPPHLAAARDRTRSRHRRRPALPAAISSSHLSQRRRRRGRRRRLGRSAPSTADGAGGSAGSRSTCSIVTAVRGGDRRLAAAAGVSLRRAAAARRGPTRPVRSPATCSPRTTCSTRSGAPASRCRLLSFRIGDGLCAVDRAALPRTAALAPASPYALSKLAQEQLALRARGGRRPRDRRHALVQSHRSAADGRRSPRRAWRGRSR